TDRGRVPACGAREARSIGQLQATRPTLDRGECRGPAAPRGWQSLTSAETDARLRGHSRAGPGSDPRLRSREPRRPHSLARRGREGVRSAGGRSTPARLLAPAEHEWTPSAAAGGATGPADSLREP